jgi:hypothetical protein
MALPPLTPDELAALAQAGDTPPEVLALRLAAGPQLRPARVATQLALQRQFAAKFPTWVAAGCALARTPCEQASSEATAALRFACLHGRLAIDCSGGMGVDAATLARQFAAVQMLEPDAERADWARWNMARLGLHNVTVVQTTAEAFWADYDGPAPDFCYADPDRRAQGGRQIRLEGLSPSPLWLWAAVRPRVRRMAIKLSPMLDATEATRKLPGATVVEAIGYSGECKELVVWGNAGNAQALPGLQARGLWQGGRYVVPDAPTVATTPPGATQWLYEPDAAIAKLRLLPAAATQYFGPGATLTHPDGYVLAQAWQPLWPGRIWRILATLPFDKQQVRRFLQASGIAGVQLTGRQAPMLMERLRQWVGLPPRGNAYVLCTTTEAAGAQVFWVMLEPGGAGASPSPA